MSASAGRRKCSSKAFRPRPSVRPFRPSLQEHHRLLTYVVRAAPVVIEEQVQVKHGYEERSRPSGRAAC